MRRTFFVVLCVGLVLLWVGAVLWSWPVLAVGVVVGMVGVVGDFWQSELDAIDEYVAALDDWSSDELDEMRAVWPGEAPE